MKKIICAFVLWVLCFIHVAVAEEEKVMTRADKADVVYKELFGGERVPSPTDPEFMEILQRNIFGEVFFTGNLSGRLSSPATPQRSLPKP